MPPDTHAGEGLRRPSPNPTLLALRRFAPPTASHSGPSASPSSTRALRHFSFYNLTTANTTTITNNTTTTNIVVVLVLVDRDSS